MDAVKQYLITITAASIMSGFIIALTDKKGTSGSIVKLLTGIFLSITVISPLVDIQWEQIELFPDTIQADAKDAVEYGKRIKAAALADSIKQQTQAYILDKADSLGLNLEVEVTLNEDDPPLPISVELKGDVSPYAKNRLSALLENDLGIPKERQLWN